MDEDLEVLKRSCDLGADHKTISALITRRTAGDRLEWDLPDYATTNLKPHSVAADDSRDGHADRQCQRRILRRLKVFERAQRTLIDRNRCPPCSLIQTAVDSSGVYGCETLPPFVFRVWRSEVSRHLRDDALSHKLGAFRLWRCHY